MKLLALRNIQSLLFVVLYFATPCTRADDLPPPSLAEPLKRTIDYRDDVFPIFSQHCIRCHSGDEESGSLLIEGRDALIKGGDSGPAIIAGNSGKSLLVQLVAGLDPERVMPPEGDRLTAEQISVLRAWIDQGAPWDTVDDYSLALKDVSILEGKGNPIDRLLKPYFDKRGLQLGPLVSDERFARRVSFDLIGLPLTNEQLAEFLKDRRPSKREELVRRLLEDHDNYVAHWMTFWSDHLRIGSDVATGIFDNDETVAPQKWLKEELTQNVPFNRFVQDLVAGEFFDEYGKSIAPTGEVASHVDAPEMQLTTTLSQVFLGIQLKCASCHDSFVDRWKLQDAWGMAAALGDGPLEIYRCDVTTNQMATPRFPLAGLGEIDPKADKQQRRREVAELMTKQQNGLFARTIVNRIWARLFGRGFVEPLDEMMEHNPWDTDLLDWLAAELIRQDYDLKKLMYLITTSQAYQRPSVTRKQSVNKTEYVFNGPEIRRLTAEQVFDCICRLQQPDGIGASAGSFPPRAWQLDNSRLMMMLGRPGRDVVVTAREQESTPLLALELINGGELEELVKRGAAAQLKLARSSDEIESRIFRTLLERDRSDREGFASNRILGLTPDQETISDLIWTIIMLPEFQLIQ